MYDGHHQCYSTVARRGKAAMCLMVLKVVGFSGIGVVADCKPFVSLSLCLLLNAVAV